MDAVVRGPIAPTKDLTTRIGEDVRSCLSSLHLGFVEILSWRFIQACVLALTDVLLWGERSSRESFNVVIV